MFRWYSFSQFRWQRSGFGGNKVTGSECTRRQLGPYGHRWLGRKRHQRRIEDGKAIRLRRRRAGAQPGSGLRSRAGGGAPGRVRGGLGWGGGAPGRVRSGLNPERRSRGARARRPGRRAPPLAGARGAEDRTERGKSGGRRRHQRQFVARRKMADLEEQLSDEEKVGAAAGRSRAAGSEGRGARAGVSPGRAPVVGRTPPLPERGSARRARPGRSAPCRVCAPKIGSGARRAGAGRGRREPGLGVPARGRSRAVWRRLAWGCHREAGGREGERAQPTLTFPCSFSSPTRSASWFFRVFPSLRRTQSPHPAPLPSPPCAVFFFY